MKRGGSGNEKTRKFVTLCKRDPWIVVSERVSQPLLLAVSEIDKVVLPRGMIILHTKDR